MEVLLGRGKYELLYSEYGEGLIWIMGKGDDK